MPPLGNHLPGYKLTFPSVLTNTHIWIEIAIIIFLSTYQNSLTALITSHAAHLVLPSPCLLFWAFTMGACSAGGWSDILVEFDRYIIIANTWCWSQRVPGAVNSGFQQFEKVFTNLHLALANSEDMSCDPSFGIGVPLWHQCIFIFTV